MEVGGWDGSGAFTHGETEGHLVTLTRAPQESVLLDRDLSDEFTAGQVIALSQITGGFRWPPDLAVQPTTTTPILRVSCCVPALEPQLRG